MYSIVLGCLNLDVEFISDPANVHRLPFKLSARPGLPFAFSTEQAHNHRLNPLSCRSIAIFAGLSMANHKAPLATGFDLFDRLVIHIES